MDIKLSDNGHIAYTNLTGNADTKTAQRCEFYSKLPIDNSLCSKYHFSYVRKHTWDISTVEFGWFRLVPQGYCNEPCLQDAHKNAKGAFYGVMIKKY